MKVTYGVCGNPTPNPHARRPEGEVEDGVYRRYPPAGAKEQPLRNRNQGNGEHLRQKIRDETGPAGETIPLDTTVAHGVTPRRTLATNHPDTIDELVRQLENWQVAQQLSQSIRNPSRPTEIGEYQVPRPKYPHRDRRPSPRSPERTDGASVAVVLDT
ncbi:unnamed protein product [Boreogadus saida]